MKTKIVFAFFFISLCISLHAENYFTDKLSESGLRGLVEVGVGRDFYKSPSGMYNINQWAIDGSATIGYQINKNLLVGIGGGARRCNKDLTTSFNAFLTTRATLPQVKLNPYIEVRGGVTGYLKWNDFVKHYYAFEGGVHVLPRLTAGLRASNFGTLDDRHSWDVSICLSFIIGG